MEGPKICLNIGVDVFDWGNSGETGDRPHGFSSGQWLRQPEKIAIQKPAAKQMTSEIGHSNASKSLRTWPECFASWLPYKGGNHPCNAHWLQTMWRRNHLGAGLPAKWPPQSRRPRPRLENGLELMGCGWVVLPIPPRTTSNYDAAWHTKRCPAKC